MAEDRRPDDQPDPDREPDEGTGPDEAARSGQEPGTGKPGDGPANPLEALFSQLSGGTAGLGGKPGEPGTPQDMNALIGQLQNAFAMLGGSGSIFSQTPESGSGVNWEVTKDTARKAVAALGPDPTPDDRQRRDIDQAASIAEVWLDEAMIFPRTAGTMRAWSRADWIEQTLPVWRRLVEPVASHIADAMEGALSFSLDSEELQQLPQMAGLEQMLRPMLRTSGASMFGLQLGQALGRLATEVVGATDIGLPLSKPGQAALLPTNVEAFGEGLDQGPSDVQLYLALREAARQRLFAAVPWLREQVLALVEEYARGITIDTSALEEAVGQIDPNNLEELGRSLEGGLFEPQKTPEQKATLDRLETMLALIEGWVDHVVTRATSKWMPAADALAETVRRNRASGGPAEATFATLVGLELRPRRMRDAANLWAALTEARGVEGRDAVWSHPDVLPTSADLDDPLGFVSGETKTDDSEFDAALAELLDAEERRDDQQDQRDGDDHDGGAGKE